MNDVEKLLQERRRFDFWWVITFAACTGCLVLKRSGWFSQPIMLALDAASSLFTLPMLGIGSWLLFSWKRRAAATPGVLAALNDELAIRNNWRAQRASVALVLVCLMVGIFITHFVDISGHVTMMMLVWLILVSQFGFYLWYSRGE